MAPAADVIAAAALTFALAGFVKGVLGFGLPTVLVAGLALFLPPTQAVALMLLPAFATNVAQGAIGGRLIALTWQLRWFLVALLAGTIAAGPVLAAWLGAGSAGTTRTVLGVALVVYAASALAGRVPPLSASAGRMLALPAGLMSGVIGSASGIFVFPTAPYLQALGLPAPQLSQAMGIAFTLATVALAGALAGFGSLSTLDLTWSAAGTVPAFAGMMLGTRLRDRLGGAAFRRLFLAALGATGLHFWLG